MADLTARDALKMLNSIKDVALRQKRVRQLPPMQIRVAELSPTAYCALMQMKGALPGATIEQLAAAQQTFGTVVDRATQIAAVAKGLRELDAMGVGIFQPPDGFWLYPNLDLLSEVVTANQLVSNPKS